MPATSFAVTTRAAGLQARTGVLTTPHGAVRTPAFLPVGTQATVKSLTPEEVFDLGGQMILANTYHLYLRPGADLVAHFGGLHRFMGWEGPLLTDSGGFQVFSLGFAIEHGVGKIAKMFPGGEVEPVEKLQNRPKLARVDEEGVTFVSHIDGSTHRLTPEKSIAIQEQLGADVIMAFDECTSPLSGYDYTRLAMERTHRWALRCLEGRRSPSQALFGIVQGGEYPDLREASACFIGSLPFEGFGIGGSLGKSKEDMHRVIEWTVAVLPEDKPRHLLGIGEPEDLFPCIARGCDTFDCVAPTRLARHGVLYTHDGKISIRNARFREDRRPIEEDCRCFTCRRFSRGYLRHLFIAAELLGYRLATIHNLSFVVQLVHRIREAIDAGTFAALEASFLPRYVAGRGPGDE
ncbi:MAG: tRNA guanosine(34) transglycosylase Tgt [Chloroflexi bacterium]|nr:tRNA guanosine(34) transglycosylase Tgt [Chloroflexota bacterium]